MELDELEAALRQSAQNLEGDNGAWEFEAHGVRMACLTDTRFDRMRLIAPVVAEAEMTEQHRRAVLEANFHTALDARYATSDGTLYSVFIHPLSPLTGDELEAAMRQVAGLVDTYGSSYSGGPLVFGTPERRGPTN